MLNSFIYVNMNEFLIKKFYNNKNYKLYKQCEY